MNTADETDAGSRSDVLEMLIELERNTSDAVKRQRSQTRIAVRAPVRVQPGNHSDRHAGWTEGMTVDISAGGCQVLAPRPFHVGDVYLITFDRDMVASPPVYARCMRCRLVRDDAFEIGFAFFVPLDLSSLLREDREEDLV